MAHAVMRPRGRCKRSQRRIGRGAFHRNDRCCFNLWLLARSEMRKDDLNLNKQRGMTGLNRLKGIAGGLLTLLAAAVVLGLLAMWAPGRGNYSADNSQPGTTVGSSTKRAPIGSKHGSGSSRAEYAFTRSVIVSRF